MKSIYLSKKEVARKLNISSSTVVRWAKNNIIPKPFRLGPNKIIWDERMIELQNLVNQYRSKGNSNYDCIVPVSGSGDSYFILHIVMFVCI